MQEVLVNIMKIHVFLFSLSPCQYITHTAIAQANPVRGFRGTGKKLTDTGYLGREKINGRWDI